MKITIIILFIIFLSSFIYADIVYLKDGSKVEGEIKKVSEDGITIDVPVKGFEGIYESKIIKQIDVDRIEKKEVNPEEKPKESESVEQKTEGKVLYRGKWITQEEKERLEKELEEQLERETEFVRIRNAINERRIIVGMTKEQVQKVIGKPNDIAPFTYQNQIAEKWMYKTGGTEKSSYYRELGQLKQYTQKSPEEVYLIITFVEDKAVDVLQK